MVKKLKKKIVKARLFQVKVTTLFFSLLGFFTLSFVSYFLYFQILELKDVDEILPAEGLVAYSEFSQTEFSDFIQDNEIFQKQVLDPFLEQYLNQNLAEFNSKAKDWLGDNVAFAVYEDQEKEEQTYYLFLENNHEKKAIEFLKNLGLKDEKMETEKYKKFTLLSFSQSLEVDCTFMYGYLVCSNQADALKKLIDKNEKESGFLKTQSNYNRTKNNLPKIAGGKAFVNLKKVDYSDYEFYLGPLKEYINNGGVSFSQIDGGIRLNSYLSLDKGLVQTGSLVVKSDLTQFIQSNDLVAYFGGTNLTQSFKQVLKVWDEITPYFAIIVEGMVRAQVVDYFGNTISLEEDLYPLFTNNYALEIQVSEKSFIPEFKLILEVDDVEQTEEILERILDAFFVKNEKFMAARKDTTLKDGSVAKELIVDEKKVQKLEEDFNDVTIHSLFVEGQNSGFAYALHDNKAFLAMSVVALKENLDLIENPEKSLSKHQVYLKAKKNMFLEGEENSFFDLQKIAGILNLFGVQNRQIDLLSAFDFAIISTKWFDDGMANEVILLNSKL